MKFFGICSYGMTERADVACQQEIKRLDLIAIFLSFVQFCEWRENSGTGNCPAPNCRNLLKIESFCCNAKTIANYVLPELRNPIAIFTL